ncbi:MAG TPA: trehalose-6-phosphate synthase [Elusimicrobiota bacterium]|nr:trehalose-6-phosphate synthase [Elusimicrobiota bacterium]
MEKLPLSLLAFDAAILVAALVIVRFTLRRPVERLTAWLHQLHGGQAPAAPRLPARGLLAPLIREAETLARDLARAQTAAEQEARLRQAGESLWTPERLREHVRVMLSGRPLVVVANREPYRHSRQSGRLEWVTPASGLVTGLEPLLRACGGTWIAHGDGDADRETADGRGRLRVPPDRPQYTLRRVWLGAEEFRGYYEGFANEGLWPLCHIAHTRPVFRASDWADYRRVNERFAEAVLDEISGEYEPCVLVQDYHFTLLPKLIKDRRPDARVALFWHIPWPNPEAFAICPWRKELLIGLLGADLIGFHTQFHCNNFLETVDRTLESRIDRERFAVKREGRATVVKPFPISVAFEEPRSKDPDADAAAARAFVLRETRSRAEFLAVGVDRLDYTKGILERLRGVERFLELYPDYRGRFTLFQIGAPSRTGLETYRDFTAHVEAEAARINARFAGGAPPIALRLKHHSHQEILPFYRAADACLVTSLHDGMNLVAKEFVVAREDEGGVLILSRFTGAARELRDALIVNPYDMDEVANALRDALTMDRGERTLRMVRLRRQVREHNVYRWAGGLIEELASVRIPALARS